MTQERAKRGPLSYSHRAHRLARQVADRTANRGYNTVSGEMWLSSYRNVYDVLSTESPLVTRRFAVVLAVASLGFGLVLRSWL
jgi:hypothetical protein